MMNDEQPTATRTGHQTIRGGHFSAIRPGQESGHSFADQPILMALRSLAACHSATLLLCHSATALVKLRRGQPQASIHAADFKSCTATEETQGP